MKEQEIVEDDKRSKEKLMRRLLSISLHNFDLTWIATQKLCQFDVFLKFPSHRFGRSEKESFDRDLLAARVCCAVLDNDIDLVKSALTSFYTPPDQDSLCFGTSPPKFAVRFGTVDMATVAMKSVCRHGAPDSVSVAKFLYLAKERTNAGNDVIDLILDIWIAHIPEERQIPSLHFINGVVASWGHLPLMKKVWDRLTNTPGFHIREKTLNHFLWTAFANKNVRVVEWLSEQPAFTQSSRIRNLQTAMLQAAIGSHYRDARLEISMITVLLKYGGDPNTPLHKDLKNRTPLSMVALSTKVIAPHLLEMLIDHGAKVNAIAKRDDARPPVFVAAERGLCRNVEVLLRRGADPRGSYAGKDFYSVTENQSRQEIKEILARYGWDFESLKGQSGSYVTEEFEPPVPGGGWCGACEKCDRGY